MATVEVICRFCHQTKDVKKHSIGKGGHQRYRCLSYHRTFPLNYSYRAYNLLPSANHLVGKYFTQRIERENLTLHN